jgi:hypothetical protein
MQKTGNNAGRSRQRINCCYNSRNLCHTLGIMAGAHSECNAFNRGSQKCVFNEVKGGVGTCLTSNCTYNDRMGCNALNIDVTNYNEHDDRKTFTPTK